MFISGTVRAMKAGAVDFIEKPFHLNFETDISYHTGDEILEAALIKKLSSQFEFSIKQTNYLEKNQRHDWLFGIAYEF